MKLTITHVAHFSAGQVYNPFSSSLFIKANGYKKKGVFSPTLSHVGENRQLLNLRVSSVNVLLASQFGCENERNGGLKISNRE